MRSLLAVIILVVLGAVSVTAQGSGFGAGVMIGEPTGISLKLWTARTMAFDAGLAWSFDKYAEMHLHADYLFHKFGLIPVEKGQLPLHYGIGGRVKFAEGRHDDWIGVRFPVGLDYHFADTPIELFIEIVPILDLAPDTELDFNGGFGARYYF